MIANQMTILNSACAPWGRSFNLVATTRTYDPTLFNNCDNSTQQARMKSGLRQGSADDLNIGDVPQPLNRTPGAMGAWEGLGPCWADAVGWGGRLRRRQLGFEGG